MNDLTNELDELGIQKPLYKVSLERNVRASNIKEALDKAEGVMFDRVVIEEVRE